MAAQSNFLNRNDAPFGDEVWKCIDDAVRTEASKVMSIRKLLNVDGPLGLGVRFIGMNEEIIQSDNDNARISVSMPVSLAMISDAYALSSREIDEFERIGAPMDLKPLIEAVQACSIQEDTWLLYGSEKRGIHGLANSAGANVFKMKSWDQVGDAVDSVIDAVTILDKAGFHGPYALALSPQLYNKLFRKFPQSDLLEFDNIKNIVTEGIIKAPVLKSGAILIDADKEYSSIIIGQDLASGFEGPDVRDYRFFISESIGLRVSFPSSICIMQS